MMQRILVGFLSTWFACCAMAVGNAQMSGAPNTGYKREPGLTASAMPPALREIGFDQNLDQQLPLDASFLDETGRAVRLGDYFGSRPVILAFVYYDCPMLCTMVLNALTSTVSTLSLDAGKDFEIVVISFDPRETPAIAAARKASYVDRYRRPGTESGWHLLTGEQDSIARVTKAAGFRYVWDNDTKQFAHPTGIIVTTPEGRPARYLFGLEYGPRDVRLALVEASQGRIGSRVDSFLLYCYHYDPMTGRYGLVIMRGLRLAGAATVFALITFVFVMVKRERPTPRARDLSPDRESRIPNS